MAQEMMIQSILWGILFPGSMSMAAICILLRPWQREVRDAGWRISLAMGLGYLIAHFKMKGFPAFPPKDASQWIPFIVAVAVPLGWIQTVWKLSKWLIYPIFFGFACLISWVSLTAMRQYTWGAMAGMIWTFAVAFALFGVWLHFSLILRRFSAVSFLGMFLALMMATSVVILLSGSAMIGQLGGAFVAALFPSLILTLWKPFAIDGAVVLFSWIFGTLLLNGFFYAEMPVLSVCLLLGSPATIWFIPAKVTGRFEKAWQSASVHLGVTLFPLVIAILIAFLAQPSAY